MFQTELELTLCSCINFATASGWSGRGRCFPSVSLICSSHARACNAIDVSKTLVQNLVSILQQPPMLHNNHILSPTLFRRYEVVPFNAIKNLMQNYIIPPSRVITFQPTQQWLPVVTSPKGLFSFRLHGWVRLFSHWPTFERDGTKSG